MEKILIHCIAIFLLIVFGAIPLCLFAYNFFMFIWFEPIIEFWLGMKMCLSIVVSFFICGIYACAME